MVDNAYNQAYYKYSLIFIVEVHELSVGLQMFWRTKEVI